MVNSLSLKTTTPIRRHLAASAVRNRLQKEMKTEKPASKIMMQHPTFAGLQELRICIDYKLKKLEEMSGFMNRVFGINSGSLRFGGKGPEKRHACSPQVLTTYPAIKGARHWATKGKFLENVVFLAILSVQ